MKGSRLRALFLPALDRERPFGSGDSGRFLPEAVHYECCERFSELTDKPGDQDDDDPEKDFIKIDLVEVG